MSGALVCPSCAAAHESYERFCLDCGLPLVREGPTEEPPRSELAQRARKVHKTYAEGPLVRAAWARNQAEAELIQGLLLEEGVPSMLRRSRGFDVPDMLAAGPRDVMVPASGAGAAREVLLQAEMLEPPREGGDTPTRVMLGVMAACVLVAVIAWLGTEILA